MPPKMRQALLISITMIALLFATVIVSYAETTNYIYDELNRLIRVEYADGTKIAYTYDGVGNRFQVYVGKYTLAVNVVGSGTVTKNPDQPIYSTGTNVTLTAVNGSQAFSEWSGDLTGNTNPTTIIMDGNKSVTATFVAPGGWLEGWAYRKSFTLSRASGAVTNYQMRLLVGETSGASGENVDCNNHILSDFDDLRFTTSDGTILLDYWIESITGTTLNRLATVWIEFDSIGTDATTFYMYYGKSDATAYSNGDATFLFFDGFPGSSLDGNKWTTVQGGVTVSGGYLVLTGTSGTRGIIEQNTANYPAVPVGAAIHSRGYGNNSVLQYQHFCAMRTAGSSTDAAYIMGSIYSNKVTTAEFKDGSYQSGNSTVSSLNSLHNYAILWSSTLLEFFQDSNNFIDRNTYVPDSDMVVYFAEASNSSYIFYIDWVFVRKYDTTEPAWGSWGAEETN
jgi:hypothetical protein